MMFKHSKIGIKHLKSQRWYINKGYKAIDVALRFEQQNKNRDSSQWLGDGNHSVSGYLVFIYRKAF
jgi:hypothetical protein